MQQRLAVALTLSVVLAGCAGPAPDPVASVAVSINRAEAPLGSPVEMSYQFSVFEDGPALTADYRVFVHFVDVDGEIMWTDDHDPDPPTSSWESGQTISYDRTLFLPLYPYLGEASIVVGLHPTDGGERLVLLADDDGVRGYRVGTLQILPQSENVFLIFQDGWHATEVAPDDPDVDWRWTQANAAVTFRNPGEDVLVYLRVAGRPDLVGGTQGVSLQIDEQEVAQFLLETTQVELRRLPITHEQLGTEEMVDLNIVVDGSFVPSERSATNAGDTRELGIRVFDIFVAKQGVIR